MSRALSRLAGLVVVLWALGFALFATTLPRRADDRRTDAIVVLTGGVGRLDRGLDLLARGRARRLLVSGVERTVRKAELAKRAGRPLALFRCCVDLGKQAIDTRSNATETAAWLEGRHFRTVRLITTDWHMPRAHRDVAAALRGSGVSILVDAVPSEPRFVTLFMEYHKYLARMAGAPFAR